MTISRPIYATVFFVTGLGIGALWSPLGASARMPRGNRARSDSQSVEGKILAKMAEGEFGPETAEYVKQFKDLTIRIKQDPIDAWAAPDGRFVINLFGNYREAVASDLLQPSSGGTAQRVRSYTFSSGGKSYWVDFGRGLADTKINDVEFRFRDTDGRELSYLDRDADGRWDSFVDKTQKSSKSYRRDGLCWKERTDVGSEKGKGEKAKGVSNR